MNKFITLCFAIALIAVASVYVSESVDISGLKSDYYSASKPLFGADEYPYDPSSIKTEDDVLSSKINWAIIVFSVLIILVLGNALDISKYTSKITGRETVDGNNVNKWLMLIFMIVGLSAAAWEYKEHGQHILLNDSASAHGKSYDEMFTITLVLTSIVFFLTQFLLFFFSFKYSYNKNRKALYYAHNNRLEIIWTLIPALVLTVLVLRGHQTWKSVVYAEENANGKVASIEVFAYQFGWKARYAGEDGKFGNHDYKFISGKNELGLAHLPAVDELLTQLQEAVEDDKKAIAALNTSTIADLKASYATADDLKDYKMMESVQDQIDAILSGETQKELEESIERKEIQIKRIKALKEQGKIFTVDAMDDIIVQEIHLAKDQLVTLNFRSKDIIHSAWLPHFRAQMNVVPGMPTKFTFKPTKTTAEAKAEYGEDFDYYLYCNKICGVSHNNMRIKVVIESQDAVDKWLEEQAPVFKAKPAIQIEEAPAVDSSGIKSMGADTANQKLAFK